MAFDRVFAQEPFDVLRGRLQSLQIILTAEPVPALQIGGLGRLCIAAAGTLDNKIVLEPAEDPHKIGVVDFDERDHFLAFQASYQ